jgi:class 3 adenylate cyclase
MLRRPLRWLSRRLGRHYVRVALAVQFQFAYGVVAGGVLLFSLFGDLTWEQEWHLLVVSCAFVAMENLAAFSVAHKLLRPADAWLRGDRSAASAVRAWRALAGLPLDFMRYRRALPVVVNVVPISVYATVLLELPFFPSFFFICAGSAVVLLYGVLLRYFAIEMITRPVIEEVSMAVPAEADLEKATLNIKARLLLALPAINIVSGVVVSALAGGRGEGVEALGWGVGAAIVVAFTISLELSLLLGESILVPLRELRDGTQRVAAGDLTTRVPVLGSDETGRLAQSFNTMVAGLEERERLREALGAYVDPGIADRIAAEGTELAGEEVEVTVMFVDIRDFTRFAERAGAAEVVAELNDFFSHVVPLVAHHGGHANKFVGDGLLAVFGAPAPLEDHADRALAAGIEVVERVRERFGADLRVGMGINSGPVVAGTIGGGGRVEFTVIGDPVNTASRVEAVTRITGDDVLLTEATRCLLRRDHGPLEERPTDELKGKTERVRLYAATAAAPPPGPDAGDRPVVSRAE